MTSTLRDPHYVSDHAKRRLSCTACSTTTTARAYPAGSQQPSPLASRRNSAQLQQQRSTSHIPSTTTTTTGPHTASSRSSPQDSLSSPSPSPSPSPNPNTHTFIDLVSPSSSSSSLAPGFTLNFNTHHSQPKIKCHIDHLHQDLDLDVKLDGHGDNNDKSPASNAIGATRFTLDCYNRSDPNKNIKLRVELVKTSPKGFGLRIMHSKLPPTSPNEFVNDASGGVNKKGNSKREKTEGDSRRSSLRSDSSRNVPTTSDFSDSDEVRISSAKMSKAGDDSEDTCKCTTPCGVPGCKAEEARKDPEETL